MQQAKITHYFQSGDRFICGKPLGPKPWLIAPRDRERCVVCADLVARGASAPPQTTTKERVMMHLIRCHGQAYCGLPVQRATGGFNAQGLVAETCVPCAGAYLARRLDLWHRSGCRGPRPTLVPWNHIGLDEPGWISRQLGQ